MSEPAGAPNLLATIVAATRTAVAARVQRTPEAAPWPVLPLIRTAGGSTRR